MIDLGLGEPDFDTPAHIVEAAHQAALAGETRYPPTGGTAALKAIIQAKLAADNDLTFAPDEIIVSNGAKQVIFNAFVATLEQGDEVILAAPCFDSYGNIISLLGGRRSGLSAAPTPGFFRISTATNDASLGEAMHRIGADLAEHEDIHAQLNDADMVVHILGPNIVSVYSV